MSERRWAYVIWWAGFLVLLILAIPTLGLTLPFVAGWWVGGPFYLAEDGEVGPYWEPLRPRRFTVHRK